MNFSWLGQYRDVGLLILRIGVGLIMIMHGWPKLAGGQEKWIAVGGAMKYLGINFWPVVWGFLAAMSETVGGALLALGFLTRPAAMALAFTMAVATLMEYRTSGGAFSAWSHPAVIGIVCFSMILIGAGKFSLDRS